MKYLKKRGPIEANTTYADGVLAAQDSTWKLPSVTFMTATIKAMGELELPLLHAIENMEATLTKIGIDKNSTRLTTPGKKNIEVRWVQDAIEADGTVKPEGCKAFMRTMPVTAFPEGELEIGSIPEGEITYTVTRYRVVIDGEEILLIDRLAGIIKINGVDFSRQFDRLL